MKPTIPLYDKRFQYTSAVSTDLHASFKRIRESLAAKRKADLEQRDKDTQKILSIMDARREQK